MGAEGQIWGYLARVAQMNERITQPFDPYEPEPSYDWDYGEATPPGGTPRVLWGRVAVLAGAAILMFIFGRCTAPDGTAELRKDLVNARQDLEEAEEALETLSQQDDQRTVPTAGPSNKPTSEATDEAPITGQTYEVQSGDTFARIAEKFYNDASLGDELAEANNYDDPTTLHTGDNIIIPPKEELEG